jgi:plastocyanin
MLALTMMFTTVYAEVDLQVKILKDSSNEAQSIKSFYPEILPIEPNVTITWVNEDSVAHSITSGMPEHPDYSGKYFKTGIIEPSKSATIQTDNLTNFAYYYFCEIHPWLTGKLVLATAPESQPETENPIFTSKPSYIQGQEVSISGQVHQDFAKTPYQILIYDDSNSLIDTKDGKFDENASYNQAIPTQEMHATKYTLKVVYGLPTQVGITTFVLDSDLQIPTWIKNGARWWSSGSISDAEFIDAIEYLAKEKVITIQKTQSLENSKSIPGWLKTNAAWWADGMITDAEFAKGLQYLVNSGIIQI